MDLPSSVDALAVGTQGAQRRRRLSRGDLQPGPDTNPELGNAPEWVGRGGVEPPTFRFSGGRSYRLSYLPSGSSALPRGRLRGPDGI